MHIKKNIYSKKLKPKINTRLGGMIDRVSYPWIFFFILLSILLFATFYFLLEIYSDSNGIIGNSHSFIDCLYFSAVTFTTLGYGDLLPEGFSKFLAILEVFTGMLLAAIFIGKISSERQSTKLSLIYASINHQKILELINDVNNTFDYTKALYDSHNNAKLLKQSNKVYDLVSIIRKYLIVQSLEGELTKQGNHSTLKRLYLSLEKIQKLSSIIIKTSGVNQSVVSSQIRIANTITAIATTMIQLHKKDDKVLNILKNLILDKNLNSIKIENPSKIYRTEITQDLLNNISKYLDEKGNQLSITKDLGISKRLLAKCLEIINKNK